MVFLDASKTPQAGFPLNFSFVVVEGGKEMLAIETDADTVVSGILQGSFIGEPEGF